MDGVTNLLAWLPDLSALTLALLIQIKVFLVLGWMASLGVLERIFPMFRALELRARGARRWLRNLSLFAINGALSPLILVATAALAGLWTPLEWRPRFAYDWVLDVLLLDFAIYWWHRALHEVPFLWRWHEVHHLDEALDVTSAVRFHVGEVFMSACWRFVYVSVLEISLLGIVVAEIMLQLAAAFHHSNLRLPRRLGRLMSYVVVTPSLHWVHHHAVRRDTDSNYSNFLSLWDMLFGTRNEALLHAGMRIGVEARRDESLVGLLVRPLRAPRSLREPRPLRSR